MDNTSRNIYVYRFRWKEKEVCVAFLTSKEVQAAVLLDCLRSTFSTGSLPDIIILLGSLAFGPALAKLSRNRTLLLGLPCISRHQRPPQVIAGAFTVTGSLTQLTSAGKSFSGGVVRTLSPELAQALLLAGQLNIAKKYETILDAWSGSHFITPSGGHTKRFIRAGNMLMHSAEIDFLAVGILRHVTPRLRHVYTDTASINSIVYALSALRRELDAALPALTIDSFGSYRGLENDSPIADPDQCLYLISASTTGGLEGTLGQRRTVPSQYIVTLLYCGPPTKGRNILCDITRRSGKDGLCDAWDTHEASNCTLCNEQHLVTVRISGDQFLPTAPHVTQFMVTKPDAPKNLSELMADLVGQKAFRCHAFVGGYSWEIYVDLQNAIPPQTIAARPHSKLQRKFHSLVLRSVPASTSSIIYLNDTASKQMADAIVSLCDSRMGREFPRGSVFSARDLLDRATPGLTGNGTALVIGSVVDTGRSLLAVSQALRVTHERRPIAYLVGLVRAADTAQWTTTTSSLRFGEVAGEHALNSVAPLGLPGGRTYPRSSWEIEDDFLKRHREQLVSGGDLEDLAHERKNIESFFTTRLAQLHGKNQANGLTQNLFWPRSTRRGVLTAVRTQLTLSPNFAFWEFDYSTLSVSQADVYVTTAAILHHMRATGTTTALAGHDHSRRVLNPRNFDRFNDGIIQAAILRAATPGELDYSCDSIVSSHMSQVIKFIADGYSDVRGAATPEFLLALACGRLRLMPRDAMSLCVHLGTLGLPPVLRYLVRVIYGEAKGRSRAHD